MQIYHLIVSIPFFAVSKIVKITSSIGSTIAGIAKRTFVKGAELFSSCYSFFWASRRIQQVDQTATSRLVSSKLKKETPIENISPKKEELKKEKLITLKRVKKQAKVKDRLPSLQKQNQLLAQEILSTSIPPLTPLDTIDGLFVHAHEVIPGLYLGNMTSLCMIWPEYGQHDKIVHNEETVVGSALVNDPSIDLEKGQKLYRLYKKKIETLNKKLNEVRDVISVVDIQTARLGINLNNPTWGKDFQFFFKENVNHTSIPVGDSHKDWEALKNSFKKAFAVIDEARANGRPILVHCGQGQSRSGTLVIAYLMKSTGLSYQQILSYVQSKRAIVSPTDAFATGLKEMEVQWKKSR